MKPSSPDSQVSPDGSDDYDLRVAWRTVAILTFVYIFSFLDRTILNLLVEPIKADLGITDTQMSFLMGMAFALFYAIFGLPLGRLADRVNRKWLIAAGLFLWNLMTACSGFARSYGQLFLFRAGVGVGEASLGPSAYSMITDLFPRKKLATAISVYSTGIYIGAGISTLIGGYVVAFAESQSDLSLPLIGAVRPWQFVFFIIGILGVIPLIVLSLGVREPERRFAKSAVPGVDGDSRSGSRKQASSIPLGEVFAYLWRNRGAVGFHHFGFAILSVSSYGVGGWIPTLLVRQYEWPIAKVGLWLGINTAVVATIGILTGGFLADRLVSGGKLDGKIRVGLISALCWLPTGIIFPLAPSGLICMLLLIPTTFFSAFATGCAAAAIQELMPGRMRGQASAIYLFIANLLGLGLGPTLIAILTDRVFGVGGLAYSMVVVGGIAHVLAGISFFLCLRHYRKSLLYRDEWEAAR